ncbi:uncharacterized protein [Acropora muricata]|uniref:uncharacterized protein n=1 Tax=Acropora muricata TaxID=159855 RepID=UPI0034E434B8
MAKNVKSRDNYSSELKELLLNAGSDSIPHVSEKYSRSRKSSSRRSSSSISSSVTPGKALAETEAAKQEAEFDKLLAEKEFEIVEMEAEEERKHQFQRAKFKCDKAVLTTRKKAVLAEAKLKAIEQGIEEEGKEEQDTLTTFPDLYKPVDTKQQTQAWVNAQRVRDPKDCVTEISKHEPERKKKSFT